VKEVVVVKYLVRESDWWKQGLLLRGWRCCGGAWARRGLWERVRLDGHAEQRGGGL